MNRERLLATFLELLQIDSPSGSEDAIAQHLMGRLQALGFRTARDEKGNVLGWSGEPGEPLLLNAHMDNVAPCCGVKPRVENGIVRSDGTTVLGGDDKGGISAILEALESTAGRRKLAPEVLFTVQEEVGLQGARAVDAGQFRARRGLVLDSGEKPGTVTIQGPGQDAIHATIIGRAAHAGVCPENGINAIVVASQAIARMKLGRIDFETTANVGIIHGGLAHNIVPERVGIAAEARSRDEGKLVAQTKHMVDLWQEAAKAAGARAEVTVDRIYDSFKVDESDPLVQMLLEAARRVGLEPRTTATGGGTDGHYLCKKGITAVALGTGTRDVHSTTESIALADLERVTQWVEAVLVG
ncbi:MAG: M20/M25/M40 family metallo-hydrolase [Bacteroidetes bacterium]|nr:M20/M25/M40 family metallo-hydrolase [Bacteroidota bacterium]MCL5025910.1 M20/M25/M40 family metallo-hydrolase [Chloroflexota bacterium]